jgi:hypothetical protein
MTKGSDSAHDLGPTDGRRPYATPTLTVFGAVANLTGTQSMDGSKMDGGPNNSKT